jgi:hypothetical protein
MLNLDVIMKKRLILVLIVLLVLLTIMNLFIAVVYIPVVENSASGAATQGTVSMCIGVKPPTFTTIGAQSSTSGTAFSKQIDATFYGSNTSITYYDNTSLFNIGQNGLISFTPSSGNVGTHDILITVNDASSCVSVNVSESFTITVNAAAAQAAAGPTGGSGGGGSASRKIEGLSFEVDTKTLRLALKQSKGSEKMVTIKNNGQRDLGFSIENPLSNVLSIFPNSFTLSPGATQQIRFVFNPTLSVGPNVYSGTVQISATAGATLTKKIDIVLEVESDQVLIDSSVDLERKALRSAEPLEVVVSLFNLQQTVVPEVKVIYQVTTFSGEIVYSEEESVTVRDQASFLKQLDLPQLESGRYILSVKVLYGESFATSTEIFTVEAEISEGPGIALPAVSFGRNIFLFSLVLIATLAGLIFVALYILHKRTSKLPPSHDKATAKSGASLPFRGSPVTIVRRETIIKSSGKDVSVLRKKLSLLKESYEKGYIKEKTYKKAKSNLRRLIKEK